MGDGNQEVPSQRGAASFSRTGDVGGICDTINTVARTDLYDSVALVMVISCMLSQGASLSQIQQLIRFFFFILV